jgi:2-polyprenyl-3-methyl-5-hydroxy-6-metoxy-1,4-benzoquinol methylase
MSTTAMETQAIDLAEVQAFAMRVLGDTTAIMMGTLHVVGDRLRLFETLRDTGPSNADAFARTAGIDSRYATEWLSAMASHGYVAYDPIGQTFSLSAEKSAVLVEESSPLYLGGLIRMQPDHWRNVDLLTDVFQDGGGIPQEHFGAEWSCGLERFTRPGFLNDLTQHWIPAMPRIHQRLLDGGSVADVGCGTGQALIRLAEAYPSARLYGYDAHLPAIEKAQDQAERAGVSDRIHFERRDVANGLPGSFDLITAFDVIHDVPHPVDTLRAIREGLAPDGRLFVLEFNLSSELEENIAHPLGLGAFGYATSVNYCMTTSLAADGDGTGTCLGERRFREFAREAGFREVVRHDFATNPFNLFFEVVP